MLVNSTTYVQAMNWKRALTASTLKYGPVYLFICNGLTLITIDISQSTIKSVDCRMWIVRKSQVRSKRDPISSTDIEIVSSFLKMLWRSNCEFVSFNFK